jgi:hypothetical protein
MRTYLRPWFRTVTDATGIPLDAPSALASSDFRGPLGPERFASARNTKRAGVFRRLLAPLFAPAAKKMLAQLLMRQ